MPAKKTPSSRPPRKAKRPAKPKPKELSNVERTRVELDGMGKALAGSTLAGAALTLAKQLDRELLEPSEAATCSRALLQIMNRLHHLAPAKPANDALERVQAKHQRRRGQLRAVK